MLTKKNVFSIILISSCLSILLGWSDSETQSLVHLFASDAGNLLALFLYALFFTTIGLIALLIHAKKKA